MMEFIERRLKRIRLLVLILLFFSSCQNTVQEGALECVLEGIKIEFEGKNIIVGQADGWTDSTSLITVLLESKSFNIPISSDLIGIYKGNDIFLNQRSLDSMDSKQYEQIQNNITWKYYLPEIEGNTDIVMPPYEPAIVQIEYNNKKKCFGKIIRGKKIVDNNVISKCSCWQTTR